MANAFNAVDNKNKIDRRQSSGSDKESVNSNSLSKEEGLNLSKDIRILKKQIIKMPKCLKISCLLMLKNLLFPTKHQKYSKKRAK